MGEGETNGQQKVSFRVNFLHKVFASAGRKKMKKTIKKKKHICIKCAAEIENVEENKNTVNKFVFGNFKEKISHFHLIQR